MTTVWTTADRDAIKAAILALAKGERSVSVTFAGRTESFQEADLDRLMNLMATIEAALGVDSGEHQSVRYAAVSRGFE